MAIVVPSVENSRKSWFRKPYSSIRKDETAWAKIVARMVMLPCGDWVFICADATIRSGSDLSIAACKNACGSGTGGRGLCFIRRGAQLPHAKTNRRIYSRDNICMASFCRWMMPSDLLQLFLYFLSGRIKF